MPVPVPDAVALYGRASAHALDLAEQIRLDQLGASTPCTEWSVQDLLDHLVSGTGYLRAAASGGEPTPVSGSTAVSREPADAAVESALNAIGHAGRRAMLRLASDGERTSSELAQIAGLSPSAASQHLKVLREAGLMHVRVDATRRLYRVDLK